MAHALVLGQILSGLALAAAVAGAAYRAGALTASGGVSAGIVGAVIFGVGGWPWGLALIVFFVSSSALSRWRRHAKEALGFEKGARRDAGQVWANGGVAAACALLPLIAPVPLPRAHLLFLAAIAAATADTWATEVGAVWGGPPRDLRTGRRVKPGASGAVSAAGTAAALAGALALSLFAGRSWWVVALAGMAGTVTDSLLGATLQARWRETAAETGFTERRPDDGARPDLGWRGVNNDVVNFFCTLAAFLVGAALTNPR